MMQMIKDYWMVAVIATTALGTIYTAADATGYRWAYKKELLELRQVVSEMGETVFWNEYFNLENRYAATGGNLSPKDQARLCQLAALLGVPHASGC